MNLFASASNVTKHWPFSDRSQGHVTPFDLLMEVMEAEKKKNLNTSGLLAAVVYYWTPVI